MVVFNYSGAEINAKIVYYGPALGGKTTNLEYIYERMPSNAKGKMVSMKTRTDRTLFFDFLPIELGAVSGFKTRMLLYTVPGQVYYNATRKLVLKGADAVVFVADSNPAKLKENVESLRNLEENLNEHDLTLDTVPWVMQYNKRDLPNALPVRTLDSELNLLHVPSFEAVATQGIGIYETFQSVAGMLYNQLVERLEKSAELPPAGPAGEPAAGNSGKRAPMPDGRPDGWSVPFVSPAAPAPGERNGPKSPAPAQPRPKPPAATRPHEPTGPRPTASGGPKTEKLPRTPALPTDNHRRPAQSQEGPKTGVERRVDGSRNLVTATLDSTLREVDDSRPTNTADKRPTRDAAPPQKPVRKEEPDDDNFRFESLEESRMDENVGRVIDFEDTPPEQTATETQPNSNGEFIINPCSGAGEEPVVEDDEMGEPIAPAPQEPLEKRFGGEEATADDACVITVPVLLSRSQIRKTIPIRLVLEIQVDDEDL